VRHAARPDATASENRTRNRCATSIRINSTTPVPANESQESQDKRDNIRALSRQPGLYRGSSCGESSEDRTRWKVAAGLGVVERVDVLPIHQMGRIKWEKFGLDYTLQYVRPPSPEMVETMCQLFCDEGLPAY
jgi:hypothetical protein